MTVIPDFKLLKVRYCALCEQIKMEVIINPNVEEFLVYILKMEEVFKNPLSENLPELAEFIRGANRYLDEFKLSDAYSSAIKKELQALYTVLK